MKILSKVSAFSSSVLWLLAVGTQLALAQAKCKVNGQEVPCDELGKQIGGFLGWGLGALFVFVVFLIWSTVFWILMIVHAAKHDVENKAMWIVIMVFTGIVGAVIYYFAVKRKFNKQGPKPPMPVISQ